MEKRYTQFFAGLALGMAIVIFAVLIAIALSRSSYRDNIVIDLSSSDAQTIFDLKGKPTLYLYNLTESTRNLLFIRGDRLGLFALAVSNQEVSSCWYFDRTKKVECDKPSMPAVDLNGVWRDEFDLTDKDTGHWERWILVNGMESNHVVFDVVSNYSVPPYPAPKPFWCRWFPNFKLCR